MNSLIIKLDKTANKAEIKRLLKHIKGIKEVTDKLSRDDYENLLDDALIKEIKKVENDRLYDYAESKERFSELREKIAK